MTWWVCQHRRVRGETGRSRQRGREESAHALSTARVDPTQPPARIVSEQYGDLVPEHHDLDVVDCIGSGEQHKPGQHAREHQVRESEGHSAKSSYVSSRVPPAPANTLIRGSARVPGTHTISPTGQAHRCRQVCLTTRFADQLPRRRLGRVALGHREGAVGQGPGPTWPMVCRERVAEPSAEPCARVFDQRWGSVTR